MMELNICLVGCGMIGREHIERIQNRIRGAKVVAVCDVFEEGVKKGAELAGPLDALVESVFHIFHTVCNYQLMGVRPRETR